jgi:hypothetical protein
MKRNLNYADRYNETEEKPEPPLRRFYAWTGFIFWMIVIISGILSFFS